MTLTAQQEADALRYDPWEGDRDSDARTMSDVFVVTRKPAVCKICFDVIPPGSRVRSQAQISREMRKAMTFRFCEPCCAAMAIAHEDWEPINARTAIGMNRAARKHAECTP